MAREYQFIRCGVLKYPLTTFTSSGYTIHYAVSFLEQQTLVAKDTLLHSLLLLEKQNDSGDESLVPDPAVTYSKDEMTWNRRARQKKMPRIWRVRAIRRDKKLYPGSQNMSNHPPFPAPRTTCPTVQHLFIVSRGLDDNHRLVEWIAYHYLAVNLRYLVILLINSAGTPENPFWTSGASTWSLKNGKTRLHG
jgi:hypothetical protein